MVNVSDKSGDVNVQIAPQSAFITLGNYRNVTVMATDKFGNQATCHFQVEGSFRRYSGKKNVITIFLINNSYL